MREELLKQVFKLMRDSDCNLFEPALAKLLKDKTPAAPSKRKGPDKVSAKKKARKTAGKVEPKEEDPCEEGEDDNEDDDDEDSDDEEGEAEAGDDQEGGGEEEAAQPQRDSGRGSRRGRSWRQQGSGQD